MVEHCGVAYFSMSSCEYAKFTRISGKINRMPFLLSVPFSVAGSICRTFLRPVVGCIKLRLKKMRQILVTGR